MTVPRERLLALLEAQCRIFATTFNPEGVRLGNKILRQRLKGPSLASYYPPRVFTMRDLERKLWPLSLGVEDEQETNRLQKIQERKDRGKGQAKKKGAPETGKPVKKK